MLPSLPVMLASMEYFTSVCVARLGQVGGGDRREAADHADRGAFDLGLDAAGRRDLRHLDAHLEAEFHEGDFGFQHRVVMGGVDLLEVAHAVDAGGEERCVLQRVEHDLARRRQSYLATDDHCAGTVSTSFSSSATICCGHSSGVRCRAFPITVMVEPVMPR